MNGLASCKPPRWGIVSTIKAPARDVLMFAAYHLEQGAHRVCIYLDAPCPEAFPYLKAHPKVRVIDCDDAYWQRQPKDRPDAHQLRQTYNANRAYRKQCKDLDWLTHIDVDEFLCAKAPIATELAALPEEGITARVYPAEVLAGSDRYFRTAVPKGAQLRAITQALYPNWGAYVAGGMLSHRVGKIFVRTGIEGLKIRIHQCFVGELKNPCAVDLKNVDLCHFHARDWEHWITHYRYRHSRGAYRANLKPFRAFHADGPTMHEALTALEISRGEEGLRAFYDEFCANTAARRALLQKFGMLRDHDLKRENALKKHFPAFANAVAQIP